MSSREIVVRPKDSDKTFSREFNRVKLLRCRDDKCLFRAVVSAKRTKYARFMIQTGIATVKKVIATESETETTLLLDVSEQDAHRIGTIDTIVPKSIDDTQYIRSVSGGTVRITVPADTDLSEIEPGTSLVAIIQFDEFATSTDLPFPVFWTVLTAVEFKVVEPPPQQFIVPPDSFVSLDTVINTKPESEAKN